MEASHQGAVLIGNKVKVLLNLTYVIFLRTEVNWKTKKKSEYVDKQ